MNNKNIEDISLGKIIMFLSNMEELDDLLIAKSLGNVFTKYVDNLKSTPYKAKYVNEAKLRLKQINGALKELAYEGNYTVIEELNKAKQDIEEWLAIYGLTKEGFFKKTPFGRSNPMFSEGCKDALMLALSGDRKHEDEHMKYINEHTVKELIRVKDELKRKNDEKEEAIKSNKHRTYFIGRRK